MISINRIKYIKTLHQKKVRESEGLFIAETPKVVGDLLDSSLKFREIWATEDWVDQNWRRYPKVDIQALKEPELQRISALATPNKVLAIVETPAYTLNLEPFFTNLTLALDGISDPGNLGTILRMADWFGIDEVLCSLDTVEFTNPKCVQASMGSIGRVKVHYADLSQIFQTPEALGNIWGTFLDGANLYTEKLPQQACILIGSEAHGIRPNCRVDHRLHIPSFSSKPSGAESLNASVAAALVCSEWRRQNIDTKP